MHNDPGVNDEAKEPWEGLRLEGHIDDDFLYTTLLSKNLVPFGVQKFHLVALPMRVEVSKQIAALPGKPEEESFIPLSLDEMRESITFARSADDWFENAEQLWEQYRKAVTISLWDRFNYQQGVIGQSATLGYLVLYGATASNISGCVVDTHNLLVINGVQPKAFVVDHKTYWYRSSSKDEAYFLAAVLNAPCVDNAIKAYQTRGIYVGPRDIYRRPFEVCAIPQYDPTNPQHQQLTALSLAAQSVVAQLDLFEGGVVAVRKRARETTYIY